jgi:N-terminal region of glycosyl transferase group 7/N-terminal domain of galactosyltransferase
MLVGMLVCVLGMFHKARLFHTVNCETSHSTTSEQPTNNAAVTVTGTVTGTGVVVQLPTLSPKDASTAPLSTTTQQGVQQQQSDPHQHALLIPYRNRTFHLERFLEYMRPYLQRHFPDDVFTVYVVEQDDTTLFNRGWLTNVGLEMIQHMAPRTQCITLHDVDLIPNGTSHVPYTSCVDRPIHLATKMENFNWAVPYGQYCGGITALSMTHWQEINGMSNDYQGT